MIEIKAPDPTLNTIVHEDIMPIFLAGSIEMDTAERWQERVVRQFTEHNVVFLNPRRDDWDTTIRQSAADEKFYEQVNWELTALDSSGIIIFYFDPNTISPITLLELGLYINKPHANVLVCCPDGYFRKGNVEIVCAKYSIPVYNNLDDLITKAKQALKAYGY